MGLNCHFRPNAYVLDGAHIQCNVLKLPNYNVLD